MACKSFPAVISKLFDGRISVKVAYSKEVIDFFKGLNNRMWAPEKKEWIFQGQALDQIMNELVRREYKVIVREYQPMVHIMENRGSHSEFQSDYDPAIAAIMDQVANSQWDYNKQKWFIPNEALASFIDELRAKKIGFTLTCKSDPEPKAKKQRVEQAFDIPPHKQNCDPEPKAKKQTHPDQPFDIPPVKQNYFAQRF